MRMKRRVPVIIGLLLTALVGLGYYLNVLLIPAYRAEVREVAEKQSLLKNKQEELTAIRELDAHFSDIEEQASQAVKALPSEKQVPIILYQLAAIADSQGLETNDIRVNSTEALTVQNNINGVDFTLSFTGNYNDIVAFLQKIETSLRLLNITDVSLGGSSSLDETDTLLTASLKGLAYFTPDDAPPRPLATDVAPPSPPSE